MKGKRYAGMKIDKNIKDEVYDDYIIAKAKMEVVRGADNDEPDSIKTFTKELINFTNLITSIREDIFNKMRHIQSKDCAEKVLEMIYFLDAEENGLDDGITPNNGKEVSTKSIIESIDKIVDKYETFRKVVIHYGMILPDITISKSENVSEAGLPKGFTYANGHVFKMEVDTRTPDTFTNLNVLNGATAEKHSNHDSSTKAVQRYYYSK
jgi:hypothetical protein